MSLYDKAVVQALRRYEEAYFDATEPKVLEGLREQGLYFPPRTMTHDESLAWATTEYALCEEGRIVESFLAGVGGNLPHLRAPLSAYAIMAHLPQHAYDPVDETGEDTGYCTVCGAEDGEEIDFTSTNYFRMTRGCCVTSEPSELAFFLSRHNVEKYSAPGPTDIALFAEIVAVIGKCKGGEKPGDLVKKIRKIRGVEMTNEEGRAFLNLLGHAGILQAPGHPGLIYAYENLATVPMLSTGLADMEWSYPVDYWRGQYGVNRDAMERWFGGYPAIISACGGVA
ncbi:MAG: hypothetical protein LBR44_09480 [Clostridiales Family XIII bacterium]|jgi:hypothetical protein|nr:hypothetical protein [Clostridiales Family XIII bacterium]